MLRSGKLKVEVLYDGLPEQKEHSCITKKRIDRIGPNSINWQMINSVFLKPLLLKSAKMQFLKVICISGSSMSSSSLFQAHLQGALLHYLRRMKGTYKSSCILYTANTVTVFSRTLEMSLAANVQSLHEVHMHINLKIRGYRMEGKQCRVEYS